MQLIVAYLSQTLVTATQACRENSGYIISGGGLKVPRAERDTRPGLLKVRAATVQDESNLVEKRTCGRPHLAPLYVSE